MFKFSSLTIFSLLRQISNELFYYYYYEQDTTAPSHLRPEELCTLLLYPDLFEASLSTPSQEVLVSLKSFLTTSFHHNRGRPAFRLAGYKVIFFCYNFSQKTDKVYFQALATLEFTHLLHSLLSCCLLIFYTIF